MFSTWDRVDVMHVAVFRVLDAIALRLHSCSVRGGLKFLGTTNLRYISAAAPRHRGAANATVLLEPSPFARQRAASRAGRVLASRCRSPELASHIAR